MRYTKPTGQELDDNRLELVRKLLRLRDLIEEIRLFVSVNEFDAMFVPVGTLECLTDALEGSENLDRAVAFAVGRIMRGIDIDPEIDGP